MKIEKINENQIRCTLNKSDLTSRQLKISELAYGSDKAKELFRDMMQQASYEFGFEAEDIPIMIEAIPISADCIVLIVTKVDDPEELDTRFSKFSPQIDDEKDADNDTYRKFTDNKEASIFPTAKDELLNDEIEKSSTPEKEPENINISSDVMNLFKKVKDYLNTENDNYSIGQKSSANSIIKQNDVKDVLNKEPLTNSNNFSKNQSSNSSFVSLKDSLSNNSANSKAKSNTKSNSLPKGNNYKNNDNKHVSNNINTDHIIRIYSFPSYDNFSDAAKAVKLIYQDKNTLYKDTKNLRYYLSLERTKCNAINFNKTCNILSEYGKKEALSAASINYFEEHYERIIKNKAIQVASKL